MEPKLVLGILERVASDIARTFPPYVMADDVYSELVVWLYQNKSSIENMIGEHPGIWRRNLEAMARKIASAYASKEKLDAEGQGRESAYQYSIDKLRDMLPDVFNYDDWQTFGRSGDGQPRGKAIVSHGGNRTAELIDIKNAVETLPDEIQVSLELYYGRGLTVALVATETDVSMETAKKRLQRALKALQKALGPQDRQAFYNRRVVRSNAAWQADNATHYAGD